MRTGYFAPRGRRAQADFGGDRGGPYHEFLALEWRTSGNGDAKNRGMSGVFGELRLARSLPASADMALRLARPGCADGTRRSAG